MKKYFFLFSSIPTLEWGSKPDISWKYFLTLLEANLSKEDFEKVKTLRFWIDLNNLYSFLSEIPFDRRGNYPSDSLKDLLVKNYDLPDYVFDFFKEFESEKSRYRNFPKLIATYFQEEKKKAGRDLKEILEFEYALRVVMIGYRCSVGKLEMSHELQFEDFSDPLVIDVLKQKDARQNFSFPFEMRELEKQIEEATNNPSEQYDTVLEYRFKYYSGIVNDKPFTMISILAQMMRLWILEDYFSLKKDKGTKILENIVEKKYES